MRTITHSIGATVFLISALFFLGTALADTGTHVTIYNLEGRVEILRSGETVWGDAVENMKLYSGDGIKTWQDSFVEVAFDKEKNNRCRIDPNTHVVILLKNTEKIELISGEMFTKLMKLAEGSTFEIRTPTAICGARGTSWGTIASSVRTVVEAFSDNIYAQGIDQNGNVMDEQTTVSEGSKSVVDQHEAPSAPERMSQQDSERWSKGREDFVRNEVESHFQRMMVEEEARRALEEEMRRIMEEEGRPLTEEEMRMMEEAMRRMMEEEMQRFMEEEGRNMTDAEREAMMEEFERRMTEAETHHRMMEEEMQRMMEEEMQRMMDEEGRTMTEEEQQAMMRDFQQRMMEEEQMRMMMEGDRPIGEEYDHYADYSGGDLPFDDPNNEYQPPPDLPPGTTFNAVAYMTNAPQASPFVTILDVGRSSVSGTITDSSFVFNNPTDIALTPGGQFVYVTNRGGGTVTVIDTSDNSLDTVIDSVSSPYSIDIRQDGRRAYVTSDTTDTVAVIDTESRGLVTSINVGDTPHGVVMRPIYGSLAFVANSGDNTVSIIRTDTHEVLRTLDNQAWGFDGPEQIAFTPDGKKAVVTNRTGDSITIINTLSVHLPNDPSHSVLPDGNDYTFDGPRGVAITPDGRYAYVANGGIEDSVSVIDLVNETEVKNITGGFGDPWDIALTPGGDFAWVTNNSGNQIIIICTDTNTIVGNIRNPTGGGHFSNPKSLVIGGVPTSDTLTKTCNKQEARVGEIITYELEVHNGETTVMNGLEIVDTLPGVFSYITESSYGTDGSPLSPRVDGRTLTFTIGNLQVDERKRVKYSVVVNPAALPGEYINRASATATFVDGAKYAFNNAEAVVRVVPDPLFDEGTILGKVFRDANANGVQDEGEEGIPGMQIVTEDGTVVTTDEQGRYHVLGVSPKTHLVKLNTALLPEGYAPTTESTRTVRMTNGLLAKASFGVARDEGEEIEENPLPALFDRFFMIGLAEGELAALRSEGRTESLTNDDRYENGYYFDGRLAYYLRATIKGDYTITSSLDTDRDREWLFRNPDVDDYYPEYGDQSQTDYSAMSTSGKLYLKLEKNESYATWGNYWTGIAAPGLAKYDKPLYGAKVEFVSVHKTEKHGDPLFSVTGFTADENFHSSYDRLRATGNSLYYLKHKNIVEGSERISIQVEDKLNGLAVSSNDLTREDYDIDYKQGRLILKKPVQSIGRSKIIVSDAILNGDPVYINASYEYETVGFLGRNNYGGSVSIAPLDGFVITAAAAHEDRRDENYGVMGIGATLKLDKNSEISFEAAESWDEQIAIYSSSNGGLDFSRTDKGDSRKGVAYSVNGKTVFMKKLDLAANYKYVEPSFSNTSVVSTQGKVTWGGSIKYDVADNLSMAVREDVSRSLRPELLTETSDQKGEEEYVTTVQLFYAPIEKLDLTGEYRFEYVNNLSGSFYRKHAQTTALQGVYKVNDTLSLIARGQATLQGKANNQFGGGFDYNLNDTTSVSLIENIGTRGNSTVFGLSHEFSEGHRMYVNHDLSGDGSKTTVGESKKIDEKTTMRQEASVFNDDEHTDGSSDLVRVERDLDKNSAVSGGYERSQFYDKGSWTVRDAVTATYDYSDGKKCEFMAKGEYRFDKSSNGRDYQILSYNDLKYRFNEDVAARLKAYYSITYDDIVFGKSAEFGEFIAGLSYRPVRFDRFNAISQYKFLIDDSPDSQEDYAYDVKEERAHVTSLECAYDINRYFQVVEKGALKLAQDRSASGNFVHALTTLWINRLNFHIDDAWNLGCEYRILAEHETKTHKAGFLVEIDRNITKYMQVGVGYNFTDFDDELTINNGFTAYGWVFKVRGKY